MAHDVVYLRGRGEEMADLLRALESHGCRIVSTRSFDKVMEMVARKRPAALIVDASASDAEAGERVLDLSDAKELFPIPTVFIGRRANERTRLLSQRFQTFIAVDFPVQLDGLISRVDKALGPAAADLSGKPRFTADPTQLDRTFGGSVFAAADDLSAFDDNLILPEHPQREAVADLLDAMTDRSAHLGLHARRTTFVSSAVANSLNFGAQRDTIIRTGSLLLNLGLQEEPALVDLDLIRNFTPANRERLSAALKKSAEMIGKHLNDDAAAQTVHNAALLLRHDQAQSSSAAAQDAQCVLASELIDRTCWQGGFWDRSGPQRAFRALRQNPLFSEVTICSAMARVLGEAAFSRPVIVTSARIVSPEEKRQWREALEEAVDYARSRYAIRDTRAVRLYELLPGMRLAEPLATVEGRLIVPPGTVVDFDLISRILGLAAQWPLPETVRVQR